jgi:hypothetical protein
MTTNHRISLDKSQNYLWLDRNIEIPSLHDLTLMDFQVR